MGHTVDDAALDTLFREARTYSKWQPRRFRIKRFEISTSC